MDNASDSDDSGILVEEVTAASDDDEGVLVEEVAVSHAEDDYVIADATVANAVSYTHLTLPTILLV